MPSGIAAMVTLKMGWAKPLGFGVAYGYVVFHCTDWRRHLESSPDMLPLTNACLRIPKWI